jgi:hypothetical protein
VAAAVTLPGCLITQPVHFDPPANSPPAIYDSPTSMRPISEIARVTSTTPTLDAGVMPSIAFEVVVADPDVGQTLQGVVEIDSNPATDTPLTILPSTASTGRERRTVQFSVGTAAFEVTPLACHRVDLFVSGGFSGALHQPIEVNDLARATWWVQPDPSVTMGSCL